MTKASLPELRRAINNVPSGELPELCIRLARFKKENKELLSYLLFEADDEPEYIRKIKLEIEEQFSDLNRSTPYMTKKGIRKILTFTNQRIRYSGQKRTEVELLIHFCKRFKKEVPFRYNIPIKNIYLRQVEKIRKTISLLHEDLQYDFNEEIKELG
jgi:hypothetical protein